MLGDMIYMLRKEAGYSQEYLGELLNLSTSAIGMYEQNRRQPNIETVISLCKIFPTSSDYLLGISDNRSPYSESLEFNNTSISSRIAELMAENNISISYVSNCSSIQKQRLENIINNDKNPNVSEVISLAKCFCESSDYILCLTDIKKEKTCLCTDDNSFQSRLRSLMTMYTELEVANGIEISIAKLHSLLSGTEKPTPQLLHKMSFFFKKSTDFLLGICNTSRKVDSNGIFPFTINEVSIRRIQDCLQNDSDEFLCTELGLYSDELYMLYHYGFIPHITTLSKLCEMYSVSADYLLGISDSKLSIISEKGNDETFLIESYRKLKEPYKKKIDGMLAEQMLQQERDTHMYSSAPANEPPKKTGTNN